MAKKGYNFRENEEEILKFWKENEIVRKVKEKTAEGEDYYFLDGPPYTSGKVHIGTAWNKTLKDCILRYKRATGFNVWDRAGYDMHGLPIEHKVQAKLGLETKEDIEKYGVQKFIEECKTLAMDNLKLMDKDFIRMGVWMGFENSYKSMSNDYVEGVWWLIKQAHTKKRLYEDFRSTYWDYEHQSALAKHELEYHNVKDKSIFLKFKLKNEDGYLVVWTTTPWTIGYNLGVMVNPELDYVKIKVKENGEEWILAKGLVGPVMTSVVGKEFEIIKEMKGEELDGLEYTHPYQNLIGSLYDELKEKHPRVHTVVMSSEYVTLGAGTGLVHMAPGCGPEDWEVGRRNKIPAWNTLLEDGRYPENMEKFSGWHAKHDNNKFIEAMDELDCLIATTEVEHDYPFGQRSHKPVVFRATKQWFFKIEDLKEKMIAENNEVKWVPESAYNAFNSWLNNLRDNSISKQRFWGTPLPIWRNTEDSDDIIVIGSIQELKDYGCNVEDVHIPLIDNVVIEKDGKKYKRVSDVLDVWVDAGTASWNCLYYPDKTENFDKLFPAEFILEGKDQIRGWFNLLSVASMLGFEKKSFNNVYMHGFVQDAKGRKMSKSLGNIISPYEVIDEFSADTLRYYMVGGSNPGLDLNYNIDDVKTKNRNMTILWNLQSYLMDLCKTYNLNPTALKMGELRTEEKLMLSKLNSAIKKCTELFDSYKINEVPECIEDLFLELSRNYIQKVRDRLSSGDDRETVIKVIYDVLFEVLKMFNTIAPFISEKIYLNLKEKFGLEEESISLYAWPKYDENMIDEKMEQSFKVMNSIIQAILFSREKAKLGVRWPVSEVVIESKDEGVKETVANYNNEIKAQVNAKDLVFKEDAGFKKTFKPDYKKLKEDIDDKIIPKLLAKLTMESNIAGKFGSGDEFELDIDGEKVVLKKEYFTVEFEIPETYSHVEFSKGNVYLFKTLNEELESEGYSREVMRRVQIARKDAGLNKTDRINLTIECSSKMQTYLGVHEKAVKEKVGADSLNLESCDGTEFKIKNEIVKIKI